MKQLKHYNRRSRISERKSSKITKYFAPDLTANETARFAKIVTLQIFVVEIGSLRCRYFFAFLILGKLT